MTNYKNKNIDFTKTKIETQLIRGGTLRSNFGETSEAIFMNSGFCYNDAETAETRFNGEEQEQIEELIDINIKGVLNIINPVQRIMMEQKNGQIVIMSSLASFKAVPGSESYSASKAYVRVFGEGLRLKLAKFNIKVNVICPGYVKTPLTYLNNFPMPFLMSSKKAAKIIKKGLDKNKSRIAFPWVLYGLILFITSLPVRLSDYIFMKLPRYSKKEK